MESASISTVQATKSSTTCERSVSASLATKSGKRNVSVSANIRRSETRKRANVLVHVLTTSTRSEANVFLTFFQLDLV
jgi:hypothetical protein